VTVLERKGVARKTEVLVIHMKTAMALGLTIPQ